MALECLQVADQKGSEEKTIELCLSVTAILFEQADHEERAEKAMASRALAALLKKSLVKFGRLQMGQSAGKYCLCPQDLQTFARERARGVDDSTSRIDLDGLCMRA